MKPIFNIKPNPTNSIERTEAQKAEARKWMDEARATRKKRTTSTHDYVTCGLCKAKLAEAGEGQDSNNAAQNSGGVGVESPRPALAYCPFCGTLPTLVQQQFDKRWMVGCGNAGCLMQPRTHLSYSQEEALMCWNTRRSFTSNVPE